MLPQDIANNLRYQSRTAAKLSIALVLFTAAMAFLAHVFAMLTN